MTELMPVVFFGHGNPMNAISQNVYSEGWSAVGKSFPRPKAVLSVSAHWYIQNSSVTANPAPRTIHDFGGFPKDLYDMKYPAPGSPELARRIQGLLEPFSVTLDESWGLDHGTWSVLTHVFPEADIPVVQLSIDMTKPPIFHYETGKKLSPLREEGILVIGSGNLVHNLSAYDWGRSGIRPFDWALRFETHVRELLLKGDDLSIANYEKLGQDSALSVPTPEHYLPLLYVLGLRRKNDKVSFPVQGVDGGSVSMLAAKIG
jgi:4,5-DOPA dioxygenase extradiol